MAITGVNYKMDAYWEGVEDPESDLFTIEVSLWQSASCAAADEQNMTIISDWSILPGNMTYGS